MTIQDITPQPSTVDAPHSPLPADVAVAVDTATPTLPAGLTATPRVWPPRSTGARTVAWDYGDPACIWLG